MTTTMTRAGARQCRPPFDRATCSKPGCDYHDPDGRRAGAGRTHLRELLTTPGQRGDVPGCDCARCAARMAPMTDIEVGHVLRHVTDRLAVLFGLGLITLNGFTLCPSCEQWAPAWCAITNAVQTAVTAGECPRHTSVSV